MAGMKMAHTVRGKYSTAGYSNKREHPMYIAGVPAGSAQDDLRDFNRKGYRTERPWNDEPQLAFEGAYAAERVVRPAAQEAEEETFFDKVLYYANREKRDAIACVILTIVIVVMGAFWIGDLRQGVDYRAAIEDFEERTQKLAGKNNEKAIELEKAQNGVDICNEARNRLKMLRPEQMYGHTETIFIQAPEDTAAMTLQQTDEPGMEMLDILLGLLNVFHIGE